MNYRILIAILLLCTSCDEVALPKPRALLRLEYPQNTYQKVSGNCPYSIEISQNSTIEVENNCWGKIHYPTLNATIHLTYRRVDKDLNDVLKEVERLTFDHTIKADAINARPFEDDFKKVYGKIINVEGNVASNIQFHVTDSVKNILFGALYFNVRPNYDSLFPAIDYIERDIRNLMESVEWKNRDESTKL